MKTLLTLFVLLFSSSVLASKILIYKEYKKDIFNENYILHLDGVESGMSWIQSFIKQKINNEVKVYCPGKLDINKENIRSAIQEGVKLLSETQSNQEIDNLPVEVILIYGLKSIFPCE